MFKLKTEIARAIRDGQASARGIARVRAAAIRKRERALDRARPVPKGVEIIAPKFVRGAGSARSAGVIVAEGDSWFDYPRSDILDLLEDEHGYDVESVAHRGDRVEAMAYSDGQLADLSRVLEKVIRAGRIPTAILLSGGGNDIAGEQFEMLLDHADSPKPGLNSQVVDGILNQRVFLSYVRIVSAVTEICKQRVGHVVPVITHGSTTRCRTGEASAGPSFPACLVHGSSLGSRRKGIRTSWRAALPSWEH